LETPENGPRYEGVVTVTGPSEGRGLRRLPGVYLSRAQIYADRDPAALGGRLATLVDAIVNAPSTPTYLITACRAGDRYGLYLRDVFTRSLYRTKLRRRGLELAADPIVRQTADTVFECDAWGSFEPSFAITGDFDDSDPGALARTAPGLLAFTLATYHLGPMKPDDLALLTRAAKHLTPVGALDVRAIATAIGL
jgi:hypothetical protein